MANTRSNGVNSFTDNNGQPLAGGLIYTYVSGTSTPTPTWTDAAQVTPNPNPIVLDAMGRATIFWAGAYKVIVRDANNVLIDTIDPHAGGISAADITALGSIALPGYVEVTQPGQPVGGIYKSGNTIILADDVTTAADSWRISPGLAQLFLSGALVLTSTPGSFSVAGTNPFIQLVIGSTNIAAGYVQGFSTGGIAVVGVTGDAGVQSQAAGVTLVAATHITFFTSSVYRGQMDGAGNLSLNNAVYANASQPTPGVGVGRRIIQAGGSPPADGMEGDDCLIY